MNNNNSTKIANQTEINIALVKFSQEEEYKRLLKYGILRLHRVFKIKYDIEKGIYGITLEDMIQETNVSFLRKEGRNWYKNKYPDFAKQFYSAFDSVIYRNVKKYLEKANNHCSILETDSYETPNDHSFEEQKELLVNELQKMGACDEEIALFEACYIDRMKRCDIAELLELSVQKITDIKRRLNRKLIKIGKYWKKLIIDKIN